MNQNDISNACVNNTIYISLGPICYPAVYCKRKGLRSKGYKTCPFDIMASNPIGIINCIKNNFKDFLSLDYLYIFENENTNIRLIRNKKYTGFCFNHESAGTKAQKNQNWKNGPNHFIDNNFKLLIERYNKRIENFNNYLNSDKKICFVINIYDDTHTNGWKKQHVNLLTETIKKKYSKLKFSFIGVKKFNPDYYEEITGN